MSLFLAHFPKYFPEDIASITFSRQHFFFVFAVYFDAERENPDRGEAQRGDHPYSSSNSIMAISAENTRNKGEATLPSFNYLIVQQENGGIRDLFRFLVRADEGSGAKFLERSVGESGATSGDQRWVIVVSIIVRKIIAIVRKPMEWTGLVVEFLLNLLSQNGELLGLIYNLVTGKVVIPHRNSETFISAIGHLDGRVDLLYDKEFLRGFLDFNKEELYNHPDSSVSRDDGCIKIEDRALMDLCMMASKLAYENVEVIKNVINHHWKMHFVDFYNGWNDFQKERSTQVFILCDSPRNANIILISFRGTEPFDADDWSTDFDYSWYEIPGLGKVHMGFLEALGLGNREEVTTFHYHLQGGEPPLGDTQQFSMFSSGGPDVRKHPLEGAAESHGYSHIKGGENHSSDSGESSGKNLPLHEMFEATAYHAVRSKLKSLLAEHKNAKFIVTGHSLGGALAILFPTVLLLHQEKEIMQRLLGIYTFGQPRVGDKQLGRFMENYLNKPVPKYYRVVYCNDLVPRLPYDDKTFLYKHFGLCLYYNSCYIEQKVEEEPNKNYMELIYLIPDHLNAAWELIRSLMMGYTHGPEYKEGWFSILLRVVGLAIPGLSAHSPVDYVNSVRLGREKVQA